MSDHDGQRGGVPSAGASAPDGAEVVRRREALARLASGVAHDLNNILAALSVELELLAGAPSLPPALRDDLALCRGALDRGTGLTRQLQAFGRGLPARRRPCDLDVVVRDHLARTPAPSTHPAAVSPAPGPLPVDADPDQLALALDHLLANAREAMPSGGPIEIETGADAHAGVAWFTVRDHGGFIPPAARPQVFEPFFPAREPLEPNLPSRRPGLGLALAAAIAEQNGGVLGVQSDRAAGTCFTLRLPLRRG